MPQRRVAQLAACLVLLLHPPVAWTCPFCAVVQTTLRQEVSTAPFVLFVKVERTQGTPDKGSADLVITQVVKGGLGLTPGAVIRHPRHIPIPDPKNPPQLLVFGEVVNRQLHLYRGVAGKQALVDYVRGVLAVNREGRVAVLQYCFDYLAHEDREIAQDAQREFDQAPRAEIRKAARQFQPHRLRRWLQDERAEPSRVGLFGYLLGNCGEPKDADLLRKVLDRQLKKPDVSAMSADQLLTGYTLLNPKAGWACTRDLVRDHRTDFLVRYAGLLSVRYFFTDHPGVVAEKDILEVMRLLIRHNDMTDLAIEDLRKAGCWALTDQILSLYGKKEFDAAIIRRSILRYALQCPEGQAVRFVAEQRKVSPTFVKESQELLEEEAKAASPGR